MTPDKPEILSAPHSQTLISRVFFNRRELRAGWRLLLFVVLWAVLLALFLDLDHRFIHLPRNAVSFHTLLAGEGFMLLAALIAAAILGLVERRSFEIYALPWSSALGSKFWQGALWGGVALASLLLLIHVLHGFNFGPLSLEGNKLLLAGAEWAAAFFVVAFYEEFFFRGYALFTLSTGIGFWPASVILSGAFGAVHLRNPGEDWTGALAAGLIGLFFCFTVRRTGNLWFAIGFHSMWDYAESFIFRVPDSGTRIAHHLFSSTLQGPAWLTGGSVGPEASVFVFVVIAALFILFHLLHPVARFAVTGKQ